MHHIDPPKEVMHIIDVLTGHGYSAYAVGGCIRDSVMGRLPKDWDITTNASPAAVKELFDRTLDTGLSHGTVTVMIDREPYEVTTFRIDGRYEDGRHPECVEFTTRLEDDLKRRDFTINAMAWNTEKGIIDLFGGMSDIDAQIVRAVGDPGERFKEDALRMLRAVRFAARLGFDIEKCTFDAIRNNCALIRKISAERIREELTGILTSDNPAKFVLLAETGLLEQILGQFGYFLDGCAGPSNLRFPDGICLKALGDVDADPCLRWAMLLCCFAVSTGSLEHAGGTGSNADNATAHNIETDNEDEEVLDKKFLAAAEDILRKLKFSNKNMDRVLRLLKYAGIRIGPEPGDVAKAVISTGEDIFEDLLKIKRAWAVTGDTVLASNSIKYIDEIDKIYYNLLASGRCLKLKDLALNGQDLMRLGYSEGSGLGDALTYLLDCVLKEPELNNKDALEKIALNHLLRE